MMSLNSGGTALQFFLNNNGCSSSSSFLNVSWFILVYLKNMSLSFLSSWKRCLKSPCWSLLFNIGRHHHLLFVHFLFRRFFRYNKETTATTMAILKSLDITSISLILNIQKVLFFENKKLRKQYLYMSLIVSQKMRQLTFSLIGRNLYAMLLVCNITLQKKASYVLCLMLCAM